MTFATFFVGFGLLFVATISTALFGSALVYLLRSAWERTQRGTAPLQGGEWQQAD